MRIVPSIILLLTASALYGQTPNKTSVNVMPSRSYVVPCSSANEAQAKQPIMRYAIPVAEWQQEGLSDGSTQFTSSFDSPFSWIGRRSTLLIEAASAPYTLWVDGREVGSCYTPSMPSEFDVTRYLKEKAVTSVAITLHPEASTRQLEGWVDASAPLTLGRVVMLSQPTMYVRDIEASTTLVSGVLNASISVVVKSEALNDRVSRFKYELVAPNGEIATSGESDLKLDMRREDTLRLAAIIPADMAWSAEKPNLYKFNIATQYRGRYLEYQSFDLGLRSVESSAEGELLINGAAQTLKATKVSSSVKPQDLSHLKAAGYNTIEVAAGEYNRALYDYADSLGLYVVATSPINTSRESESILRGGNPTNDPTRTEEYLERVDAMYHGVKNHASVVAISLAEDNSQNGINLYESYIYLKARDKQRPIIYNGSQGEWNNDPLKIDFR